MDESLEHCLDCGAALGPDARFCPGCGREVAASTPGPSTGGVTGRLLQSLRSAMGDRYRVHRTLGRGGWGYVFLAQERRLDRWVAIKVLAPHLSEEEGVVDRFLREARAQARLNHPNIVTIHGISSGDDGGLHYIIMEYMPGRTLGQVLKVLKDPLDPELVGTWILQVGTALEHAHRQDIVHRDVKPGNILFDAWGNAHVGDFGIAKVENVPRLTQVGMVMGTPTYMSPEQFDAEGKLGPASDQYSLGVVAYEMLAGQPPFEGSDLQLFRAHQEEEAPPLRAARPEIPEEMAAAVARMLRKDPAERFPSIGQAAAALGGRLPGPSDPLVAVMTEATTHPTEIRIDVDRQVRLETGERVALAAVACGPDGRPLPQRQIEWTSENPGVVDVTPDGLLVGVGQGTATIMASCEGVAATTTVTVTLPEGVSGPAGVGTGESFAGAGETATGVADVIPAEPVVPRLPDLDEDDHGATEILSGWAPQVTPERPPAEPTPPAATPTPAARTPTAATPTAAAPTPGPDGSTPGAVTPGGGAPSPGADAPSPVRDQEDTGTPLHRRPGAVAGLAAVALVVALAGGWALFGGGGGGGAPGTVVVTGDLPEGGEVRLADPDGRVVAAAVAGEPLEVAPGEYVLLAGATGFAPFETRFTVESGEEREVRVVLEAEEPIGPLAVADTLEDPPLDDVAREDQAVPAEEAPPVVERPSDAQGRLVLAGDAPRGVRISVRGNGRSWSPAPGERLDLPPGSYVVEARADGYEPFRSSVRIDPSGDARVVVALERSAPEPEPEPEAPSTGTVRITGSPPPGGRMELRGASGTREVTPGSTSLPAGAYELVVSAPGRATATVPLTVRAGGEATVAIPPLEPADVRQAGLAAVEAVVQRFDRRDAGVADLMGSTQREQYRRLLSDRTNVRDLSARLLEVQEGPELDGSGIRVRFLMQLEFNSGYRQSQQLSMLLRLTQEGERWVPATLEVGS